MILKNTYNFNFFLIYFFLIIILQGNNFFFDASKIILTMTLYVYFREFFLIRDVFNQVVFLIIFATFLFLLSLSNYNFYHFKNAIDSIDYFFYLPLLILLKYLIFNKKNNLKNIEILFDFILIINLIFGFLSLFVLTFPSLNDVIKSIIENSWIAFRFYTIPIDILLYPTITYFLFYCKKNFFNNIKIALLIINILILKGTIIFTLFLIFTFLLFIYENKKIYFEDHIYEFNFNKNEKILICVLIIISFFVFLKYFFTNYDQIKFEFLNYVALVIETEKIRIDQTVYFLSKIFDKPIFGHGLASTLDNINFKRPYHLYEYYYYENSLLSLLFEIGIVGTITLFYIKFNNIFKLNKNNLLLLGLATLGCFTNPNIKGLYFIIMICLFLALNKYKKIEKF